MSTNDAKTQYASPDEYRVEGEHTFRYVAQTREGWTVFETQDGASSPRRLGVFWFLEDARLCAAGPMMLAQLKEDIKWAYEPGGGDPFVIERLVAKAEGR